MENFKKYLPWIIGGIVLLFILSRLRGGNTKTALLPQTEIIQTPQTDPLATLRGEAFNLLAQLGIATTEAESEAVQASIAGKTTLAALESEERVRLKALDVDLSKANIAADALLREANLNFFQRENDRRVQQSAIDRFYSSRTTGDIIGSINTAIQGIFNRNRGGSIVRTPPIFGGF